MKKYALVVAGGIGTRMQRRVPKQFIPVAGLPILMHTLDRFRKTEDNIQLVLVLPEHVFEDWDRLRFTYQYPLCYQLVAGGNTRIDSVRNGLQAIDEQDSLVAIHDGVRPFVSASLIENSYQTAQKLGNAIAAVPLKDSIREINGAEGETQSRNRANYRLIQTPQTFRTEVIREAYQAKNIGHLTDDASVAEHAGLPIHLIAGDYKNIKITTPEDLLIAEAFLKAAIH